MPRSRPSGPLIAALGITTGFLIVEAVAGFLTGSLALVADAGHMLVDAGSLTTALVAQGIAMRPASIRRSYGYQRAEVIAALVNGMTLVLVALWIVWEAYGRLQSPPEVKSLPMLLVACVGLAANLTSAAILMRSAKESLNVQSAFLHVLSDGLGSIGAIVAGLVMLLWGWYIADPIISVCISLLILAAAGRVIWRTVHVLLEGTPSEIDLRQVESVLCQSEHVRSVHDLHVWTLTSGYNVLSAHVVLAGPTEAAAREALLTNLHQMVEERFPIQHTTIQLEETTHQCTEAHTPRDGPRRRQGQRA